MTAIDNRKMLVYEMQAEVTKAVAHPIRIAIVDFLKDGEQCVCDIAEHVAAQRSNVSRHLSVMVQAGVLESRKEGLKVMYSLRTACMVEFLSCVEQVLRERIGKEAALLNSLH